MIDTLLLPNCSSPISISRIGFGCEQLGMHNWGEVNEMEINIAIQKAIDSGISFFDTADVYGLGRSEENLGKFLGTKRKKISIITKFGVRFVNGVRYFDNSPKWIEKALSNSLKRLKTDYIDIYQLHYWDEITDLNDIISYLQKVKDKGIIRAYGFSNIPTNVVTKNADFFNAFSISSYEFSLAQPKNFDFISTISQKIPVFIYGGLGQGVLTGKYDESSVFGPSDRRSNEKYKNFHGEIFKSNLRKVNLLKEIASVYNVSAANIAVRYILDVFPNSTIIAGIKNREQVSDNLRVFEFKLKKSEIDYLTSICYE